MKINARAIVLLAASAFVCPLAGAETRPLLPLRSATTSEITVPLEYREVPFGVMNVTMRIVDRSQPFRKEANAGKSSVRRGYLQVQSTTNAPVAFLWNISESKLYLDSNRNEDLTDDPGGVYSGAATSFGGADFSQGSFTNVHLDSDTESGLSQWLVDLSFSEFRKRLSVYAGVRSFHAGQVSLDGNDWQVALVSGTPGISHTPTGDYLLLRPWTARDREFNVQDGLLDAFPFRERVFVQNRIYQIAPHYERKNGKLACSLTIRSQPAELGELKVSGKFIQRVILTSAEGMAVVIDKPEGLVRIPAATYTDRRVQLGNASGFAYLERPSMHQLVVARDRQAELTEGGPLTNTVSLTRRGSQLQLIYRLIGAGEEAYVLAPRNLATPPQFTAYQGTRKIASGKFEFG